MSSYLVENTIAKEHQKKILVKDGQKKTTVITVHRYAQVGKGDYVIIDKDHPHNIYISSTESPQDLVRISPHFNIEFTVSIGEEVFQARITEITKFSDLQALTYLEQYHYKSFDYSINDTNGDEKSTGGTSSLGGRKAILLLYLKLTGNWRPIGYIELQMPLLFVKPRHSLFNSPFLHDTRPIRWEKWDQHTIRKFVNLIVRIARIVVAPDYRGLSFSRHLISTAKSYCKERWHINGRRPIFLEISAEMLNYIDFVSSSGFRKVGLTEGNIARVVKDLTYMSRGYDVNFGMMSLQKKYLTSIQEYCKHTGCDFKHVLDRLAKVLHSSDPLSELTPDEYLAFRSVIRFPIPYYICPIDPAADRYLRENLPFDAQHSRPAPKVSEMKIALRGLRVVCDYQFPRTRNTRLVIDAFGIKGDHLQHTVFGPIDLDASSGNIFFIAGPNGSGKSVFLKVIDPDSRNSATLITNVQGDQKYSVSWLRPLPSDVPVFEYFAERYSPQKAFGALSQVGLSEAFIFLKPFPLLSRGQRYRAMLADMLLRDDPVWLIDEFCADLDPFSAKVVAHNLRKQVMRTGRICFAAAANHAHFINALRPTRVIILNPGTEPSVLTFRDYKDEFLCKAC